jgi:hypothetical protein
MSRRMVRTPRKPMFIGAEVPEPPMSFGGSRKSETVLAVSCKHGHNPEKRFISVTRSVVLPPASRTVQDSIDGFGAHARLWALP